MNYSNLREKLIPKYANGDKILTPGQQRYLQELIDKEGLTTAEAMRVLEEHEFENSHELQEEQALQDNPIQQDQANGVQKAFDVLGNMGGSEGGMAGGANGGLYSMIGGAIQGGINIADKELMGDKNFSAQSQAIDSAVHGVSGALIQSGNPYAMAAGVALEGLNFASKAGGKTVSGFDVDIESSGYGTIGHKESESGRVWDTWTGKMGKKLAKRNEQARMALTAADISAGQNFEQEARSNSIQNVLEANQIALAGGIDTSLLGN